MYEKNLPLCVHWIMLYIHMQTWWWSGGYFQVKTHLQALSSSKIAVGFQHSHAGMIPAIRTIFRDQGIRGLFRGVTGAVPRVTVGSSVQLSTFSTSRDYVERLQVCI